MIKCAGNHLFENHEFGVLSLMEKRIKFDDHISGY